LIVGKSPLSCRYAQYASSLRYLSNLLANGDLLFMEVVPWNASGGDAVLSDLGRTTHVILRLLNVWSAHLRRFENHNYLVPTPTLSGEASYWRQEENMMYPSDKFSPDSHMKTLFRMTKTKPCNTDILSLEAFPVPYWKITMNLSPWAPCLVSPTWLPTSRSWIWGTQSRKSVGENPASGLRWHTTTMTQVWKPKWRTTVCRHPRRWPIEGMAHGLQQHSGVKIWKVFFGLSNGSIGNYHDSSRATRNIIFFLDTNGPGGLSTLWWKLVLRQWPRAPKKASGRDPGS